MSMYHSLLYVAFLISFAQCQTTLSQAEISKILQIIQNQTGGQTVGQQGNNVDTVQLIRKLMASTQSGNQAPQTNYQPQAPIAEQPTTNPPPQANNLLLPLAVTGAIDNPLTALAASSMVGGNQGGGGGNLNGYLTARAFDFNDLATNMMLVNGLNGQKQPQQAPQPQPLPPSQPQPQPQPPAVNQGTQQPPRTTNGGLFGQSPMGNYFTARAFDFPDMYTNMMLFNGVNSRQATQQPGSQQQTGTRNQPQSIFDPTLFYLSAF